MDKLNLKNILTAVRDMILRHRVAYKDYLGVESVIEEKKIMTLVRTSSDMKTSVNDSSFKGFVAREVYTVTKNGEAEQVETSNIIPVLALIG